jgi:hypothetical protein
MHYKLLGFTQAGSVRRFWFSRIGPLGVTPVPFTVLADTAVARRYSVPLQELPVLCSRMLNAASDEAVAATLMLSEDEISVYAAEAAAAKAQIEAVARQRRLQQQTARAESASV